MIRLLLGGLSPSGKNGRFSIFIFHRVLSKPDLLFPDEPDTSRFNQILSWIKQWFNVVPLDVGIDKLKAGTLPSRAAAITFDDGYADNYTNALPILKQHGLSATFFIATGFLDGGRMWNDIIIESIRASHSSILDLSHLGLEKPAIGSVDEKKLAITKLITALKYRPGNERVTMANQIAEVAKIPLPTDLMMTSLQVIAMQAAGMKIGAHTVSHPILSKTELTTAKQEIAESKIQLEKLLGNEVSLFAYPNGKKFNDYLPEHADLVRELGFKAAVSTQWGASDTNTDLFNIPRFTPWDKSKIRFGLRLVENLRKTPN